MIMKSRTFFILVFIFLVSLGCFSCKTTATDDFSIDSEIAYCRSQAMRTLVSIPSLDKIPNSMDLDSIKWRYTQVGSWTCGFWPGILWYLYEDTKDNMWREAAGKVTDMIAPLAYRKAKSHDSGFIMMCSLGNGYYYRNCNFFETYFNHVRCNRHDYAIRPFLWKNLCYFMYFQCI